MVLICYYDLKSAGNWAMSYPTGDMSQGPTEILAGIPGDTIIFFENEALTSILMGNLHI